MKRNIYNLFSLALAIFLLAPGRTNAQSPLPNFDFENWTTDNQSQPLGWMTNNTYGADPIIRVNQVTGMTGNGIHLHTEGAFPVQGYIYNTTGYIFAGTGGVPYSG